MQLKSPAFASVVLLAGCSGSNTHGEDNGILDLEVRSHDGSPMWVVLAMPEGPDQTEHLNPDGEYTESAGGTLYQCHGDWLRVEIYHVKTSSTGEPEKGDFWGRGEWHGLHCWDYVVSIDQPGEVTLTAKWH